MNFQEQHDRGISITRHSNKRQEKRRKYKCSMNITLLIKASLSSGSPSSAPYRLIEGSHMSFCTFSSASFGGSQYTTPCKTSPFKKVTNSIYVCYSQSKVEKPPILLKFTKMHKIKFTKQKTRARFTHSNQVLR